MKARAGHASRTKLEAAVCEEMGRQKVPHGHRSLRFRIQDADGEPTKYSPAIAAHRGPILFLVEPLPPSAKARLGDLIRFLEQHSPEIVLIVLAPDASVSGVPAEAYDEIYPASEVARLVRRIREQAPAGLVRPFLKPGQGRDAAK